VNNKSNHWHIDLHILSPPSGREIKKEKKNREKGIERKTELRAHPRRYSTTTNVVSRHIHTLHLPRQPTPWVSAKLSWKLSSSRLRWYSSSLSAPSSVSNCVSHASERTKSLSNSNHHLFHTGEHPHKRSYRPCIIHRCTTRRLRSIRRIDTVI